MTTDQQQRQRADALRHQLKQTMQDTAIAIQSSRDLIRLCQRRLDTVAVLPFTPFTSPLKAGVHPFAATAHV